MNEKIKILMLEDSPSDAKLIQRELKREKLDFIARVVDDKDIYIDALISFAPDIILCDHSLPGFNSMDALFESKRYAKDTPFILVTGSVSEEYAVLSLKAGAQDYILKTNLSRLPLAITTALRQKEAERRLRESEEQFQHTIDGMIDGVQIIGYDWRYLYVNDAVAKHAKFSKEELVGYTMMEKYPEIEGTKMFEALQRCMHERVFHEMENQFVYPDGSSTWFKLTIQPSPGGVLILSRDITDKKQAMRQLEEQNSELRKINSELDRFVYSASHELRAPLCTILGLNTLSRALKSEEQRLDLSEKIEACVGRLDNIIHEIVDFSRNSRVELKYEPIDFHLLFEEAKARYLQAENAGQIAIDLELRGKYPFYSDKERLKVIMNNILSNAVKYRNPGRKDPYVKVAVSLSPKKASLEISDNGPGIEAAYLDSIFKMFFRGTESSDGSGLGLYIVKEIIDKLQGTIRVESTVGQGSSFFLTIPNAQVSEPVSAVAV